MAYAITNEAPLGAVATLRVVDTVRSVTNNFFAWKNERATRKILSHLTAEQLQDIGLVRIERF